MKMYKYYTKKLLKSNNKDTNDANKYVNDVNYVNNNP
jgi:hypothetical protein